VNPALRAEVARVSRKLHAAGWCANHDGNVSVRLGRDRFLCTPTAVSKADVDESMLIVVDSTGALVEGTRKPFGELDVHLALYRARPDAMAVLHAHPPHATAFGIAGISLEIAAMPEVLVSLGTGVPTVPLHLPKTPELIAAVSTAAQAAHAFLAAGNGAWSMGVDLEQAYLRLELVEHYAKIIALARQLGGVNELAPAQVAKMLEARKKAGLQPPGAADATPPEKPADKPFTGPDPRAARPARPAGFLPADFDAVAEAVVAKLGNRAPNEGELKKLVAAELAGLVSGRGT